MRIYPILCCVLISTAVFAGPVDSLENVLKTAQGDQKVKTLNELFRAHMSADPVKAIGYTKEALELATNIGDIERDGSFVQQPRRCLQKPGELSIRASSIISSRSRPTPILTTREGIATTKNNIAKHLFLKERLRAGDEVFPGIGRDPHSNSTTNGEWWGR